MINISYPTKEWTNQNVKNHINKYLEDVNPAFN